MKIESEIIKINLLNTDFIKKYIKQGYSLLNYNEKEKTIFISNDRNYMIEYNGKVAKMYNPRFKNTLITDGINWTKKKYDDKERLIKEEFSTGHIIEYSYYDNNLLRLKKDNYGLNEYYEYDKNGNETYYVNSNKKWIRKEELDKGNCIHIYDSENNFKYKFKKYNLIISGKNSKIKVIKINKEDYLYSKSRYNNFIALLISGDLYFKNVKKQYSEQEIFIFTNIFQISNYEEHKYNLNNLKR